MQHLCAKGCTHIGDFHRYVGVVSGIAKLAYWAWLWRCYRAHFGRSTCLIRHFRARLTSLVWIGNTRFFL